MTVIATPAANAAREKAMRDALQATLTNSAASLLHKALRARYAIDEQYKTLALAGIAYREALAEYSALADHIRATFPEAPPLSASGNAWVDVAQWSAAQEERIVAAINAAHQYEQEREAEARAYQ